MKTLTTYITEKFRVSKDMKMYMYAPKSWDELRELIRQRYKELGPGTKQNPIDFNDIDVSGLKTLVSDNRRGVFEETEFEYIDVSRWNVSNIKNMHGLFFACRDLVSVGDISKWDISECEDISSMFCGCWELKQINVSNWKTKKVKEMDFMFSGCKELKSVGDLSKWDVSSVKLMQCMFDKSGITNIPKWYK